MSKIEELLKSMQTKYSEERDIKLSNLKNTIDTWHRIKNKDDFKELGFSSEEEKEEFLSEWIEENPYSDALP